MEILGQIVLASIIISLISLIGGFGIIHRFTSNKKLLTYFVSFAAGVMLASAFIDLFPEAIEAAPEGVDIFMPALLGIISFFFLERFVLWFHHHDDLHSTHPSALLINVGDGVHNFIDGVVIAATFLSNPAVGFVTTIAIAAHEIPQELADFSILIHGGLSKAKALFYNFLSALLALLGSILGYYFLEHLNGFLPYFLSFTAGMFIYIACSDLIPDLHQDFKQKKSWGQAIPFLVGVLIIFMTVRVFEGR